MPMRSARRNAADQPLAAIVGFAFPRHARLRSPGDFRRVYSRGTRAHGQLLVVIGVPRGDGHRLGVVVSKEHGTAVRRNKLKRILREAFRLERPTLGGAFDLIVIPRKREGHLEIVAVRAELIALVGRLTRSPPGSGSRPRRSGRSGRSRGKRSGGSDSR